MRTKFFPAILLFSSAITAMSAESDLKTRFVTPAEWLKLQPKPAFRVGHTLPPLTRYGWDIDDALRNEMAESWGYTLEFGVVTDETVARAISDPNSREAKRVALALSNPKRYRLSVESNRKLPDESEPAVWTRNKDGKFLNAKARSLDGNEWSSGMDTVFSLVSPDSYWRRAGELSSSPLRRLRAICPISIVLNAGEYGLGVSGFAKDVWGQDPEIMKAKGDKPWADFVSERKVHYQTLMSQAEFNAVPDRLLYIYYTAGGGTHRNVFPNWGDWSYLWENFKGISDLPSNEAYFQHFNSGFTGERDILTLCLNAAAREIADGKPLSYNWLSAGWEGDPGHSHAGIARWMGFLKCYYTAGMIGGNAGYYQFLGRDGLTKPFDPNSPPHWLLQIKALSDVHAQFSHSEDMMRNSDLLPGPNKHCFSKDLPAYEFPSEDKNVRVVIRKHRHQMEWLVTAWASDGDTREIKVSVPILGTFKVSARANGIVYQARLSGETAVLTPLN